MHTAIRSSRKWAGPALAPTRAAARSHGLPAFDILAGGVHGFFPGPRGRQASGAPVCGVQRLGRIGGLDRIEGLAPIEGLDRVERRVARHWVSGVARGRDLFATAWISVPFLMVFVLGCLTLG